MQIGLVSVTFRQLSPREIVGLVVQSGLEAIEWGGDVHVPHGDIQRAQEVKAMTEDAGLVVVAYGSYYRAGLNTPFGPILETAIAVNAPTVRIWAGTKGSAETNQIERESIVRDIQQCCDEAAKASLTVSLEYHRGTLTDEIGSCMLLIEEVGHPNLKLYWQPDTLVPHSRRVDDLKKAIPQISNIHVFQWTRDGNETLRHELKEGESEWLQYLEMLRKSSGFRLIEFVKGDSPDQFLRDAETLKRWGESIMKA